MIPAVRACADRLIYDSANVKYVATNLPKGALERSVEGTEWTVRQSLMHLGTSLLLQAAALERIIAGEPPLPEGFSMDAYNKETVTDGAPQPLPEILGAIELGRARLLDGFERVDEELAARPLAGMTVLDVMTVFSKHLVGHSMAVFDALPELRYDAMALNWLLYAEFEPGSEQEERQQRLFADVREKLGRVPTQGDIDQGDDDGDDWDDDDAEDDE